MWGIGKRAELHAESANVEAVQYDTIAPAVEIGLPFTPATVGADYLAWPRLPDLFPVSFPGVKTSRDSELVEIDREQLLGRIAQYFDPSISHAEMRRIATSLMSDGSRFKAEAVRDILLKRGFLPTNIVRYAYRPFDVRWLYWEPETKLLDEKRPEYFPHVKPDNMWIEARQHIPMERFDRGMFTAVLADNLGNGLSNYFPLYLYNVPKAQAGLFDAPDAPERTPNLSDRARAYLDSLGVEAESGAPLLFYHVLAVLHSPAYRVENAGALRQDWPRVPLPASPERLSDSAELGRQVAALLDVETPVPGVTSGSPRADLAGSAVLTVANNRVPDFNVTVNWGYFGAGSAVMPGRGRSAEHDGLIDVYLNETTYWRDIPLDVWNYTLGGYQVLKKWLSYRETDVLGRPLDGDEARTFMYIARRIAALLALDDDLDLNYRGVSAKAD